MNVAKRGPVRWPRNAAFRHMHLGPRRFAMNGDGVVDIGDALVVAQFDVQCDVRLIGCAFICGPFACPSTTSRRCWASPPTTCSTWHAGSITGSEQLVIPLRSPEAVSRCQPVASPLKRYGRVNDDRYLA